MRNAESEVLTHLRKHDGIADICLLGRTWSKAFHRLCDAKMVRYLNGRYRARKYARPVTKEA